jgi:enamine deaminase RidA (YjgF/YER057c/UK114 family)
MSINFVDPPTLAAPHGYSHAAVTQGQRTIYLSGQVSVDLEGQLVGEGDHTAQAERALLNLVAALEGAGASVADLAKISIYVVDHNPETDAAVLRGFARGSKATGLKPVAAVLVGVTSLALPGGLIEIEGIAVAD